MTAPQPFTELVYDAEARGFISETWPQATFEDASAELRRGRFLVTIPGITAMDFYPPIMVAGWADACLGFGLAIRMPDRQDDVRAWLDAAKAVKAAS